MLAAPRWVETVARYSPILLGNICSSSILLCTQAMRCSMYSGAAIFVGRLYFSESCHRYSNLPFLQYTTAVAARYGAFLLICCLHLWTRLGGAELGDGAVEEVDLVIEVDDCSRALMLAPSTPSPGLISDFVPLTASHSLRSSPSGSLTALRRLPLPSVASANCRS